MKEEILKYYYGYDKLKPEQNLIIDSILEGNDTIGILPTGFGKTICFVIPALILEGLTIVVCPLISLMIDQVNNLKNLGISAEYLNSSLDDYKKKLVIDKLKRNKIKILYLAAERLMNNIFLDAIKNINISLIVCDEAHTLLWSEDFRYGMLRIKDFIKMLNPRPNIMALSATSTSKTSEKITEILNLNNPKIIKFECDRKNIFYKIINTKNKDKDLFSYINGKKDKIIIYSTTIKNVIHIKNLLESKGILCSIYHGKLDSKEKDKMFRNFKENITNIMIATNAFGMGIDIPDIRYIIEYNLPSSIEDFSQQIGRASRDGKYAEGVILFDIKDIKTNEYFIDNISNEDYKEERKIKKDRYKKLDQIIKFCLEKKCLHKAVLNYFGFDGEKCKNMCSNCNKNK